MGKTIFCKKLGIEAEGLDLPPFPGEQGLVIYENISKQAWADWLKLQTMLINENKLTPFEAKAKAYLAEERRKFLFGGGTAMPEDYVPPK
jgi:Fe-S cluster biosynthesis and repair protein YggX